MSSTGRLDKNVKPGDSQVYREAWRPSSGGRLARRAYAQPAYGRAILPASNQAFTSGLSQETSKTTPTGGQPADEKKLSAGVTVPSVCVSGLARADEHVDAERGVREGAYVPKYARRKSGSSARRAEGPSRAMRPSRST